MGLSIAYLIARLLSGLASVTSVFIFTRIMDPAALGVYAYLAALGFLAASFFTSWIAVCITRFTPGGSAEARAFAAALRQILTLIVIVQVVIAAVVSLVHPFGVPLSMPLLVAAIASGQAAFEFALATLNAGQRTLRYAIAAMARPILFLCAGAALWAFHASNDTLAYALAISFLGASFIGGLSPTALVRSLRLAVPSQTMKELLSFGLPIVAVSVLGALMTQADRILLTHLASAKVTGVYSVAVDLTQQTLYVAMSAVNLAFLARIYALSSRGDKAAVWQWQERQFELLAAIAIPATTAFALLSTNIAHVLIGPQFVAGAARLLPLIAVATLFAASKTFYFDLSFQFAKKTFWQIVVAAAAAFSSLLLNILLIPRYGMTGAASVAIASCGLACVLSFLLGRWYAYRLPFSIAILLRITAATALMSAAIFWLRDWRGIGALCLQVSIGL